MSKRIPIALLAQATAAVLAIAVLQVIAGPSADAVRTTGWATWTPITGTSNNYATSMQLPALGFPKATVTSDSRGNVALPSGDSTFLGGSANSVPTAVGLKYGSSKGNSYLNLRPKADNAVAPSTTTYTFDGPTPDTGWTFVLGDIDADQVQISAKGANGEPLTAAQINDWKTGHDAFNYAGDPDLPSWNAATATLIGNPGALDTNGAAAWFEPNVSISSLTFVYTRRSGFPVYQTWFASVARTISGTVVDDSTAPNTCPVDTATVELIGPNGNLLASTHPQSGSYSFGQYATQAGYQVRVTRPASCAVVGPAQLTVSTAAGDASADFAMREIIPQPVSGTVRTTGGEPVAGVSVTLTPPGGGTPITTTTAVDGTYLFDDNAELPGYTVAIGSPPAGFTVSGASSRSFNIAPGTPVIGQDFALTALPSLSGTIAGGDGPIAAVTVTLTPTGGGPAVTAATDTDGRYEFSAVPAGTYDIAVTPPAGFRAVADRTSVAVSAADVTGQDFVLSRPGSLSGQVLTDTSAAVLGAEVNVAGPTGTSRASTDAAGNYFLGDLDPGAYRINVIAPNSQTAVSPTSRVVTISAAGEALGGQDFVLSAVIPPSNSPSPQPSASAPSTPSAAGPTAAGGTTAELPSAQLAATGAPLGLPALVGVGILGLGLLVLLLGRIRRDGSPRAH